MTTRNRKKAFSQKGQAMIEYAIVLAMVAAVCIQSFSALASGATAKLHPLTDGATGVISLN